MIPARKVSKCRVFSDPYFPNTVSNADFELRPKKLAIKIATICACHSLSVPIYKSVLTACMDVWLGSGVAFGIWYSGSCIFCAYQTLVVGLKNSVAEEPNCVILHNSRFS